MESTILIVIFGFILFPVIFQEGYSLTSNSACIGAKSTDTTSMLLFCKPTHVIRVVTVTAGAKRTALGCPLAFTGTGSQDMSCCSPSTSSADDCLFSVKDISDFEAFCNDKQRCTPEAKSEITEGYCDADFPRASVFMYVNYTCVEQTNSKKIDEEPKRALKDIPIFVPGTEPGESIEDNNGLWTGAVAEFAVGGAVLIFIVVVLGIRFRTTIQVVFKCTCNSQ